MVAQPSPPHPQANGQWPRTDRPRHRAPTMHPSTYASLDEEVAMGRKRFALAALLAALLAAVAACFGATAAHAANLADDVFAYGDAFYWGSTGGFVQLTSSLVDIERSPTVDGYWLLARDGGVFTYGYAKFYGSTGNMRLNQPVVGMTAA